MPPSAELDDDDMGKEEDAGDLFFKLVKANENSSDLTGRFPYISRRGYQYMLISIYLGYIHIELMKNRSAAEYARAMRLTYLYFSSRGHMPTYQSLDNETSAEIESYLKDEVKVTLKYVPSNTHRRLRAERAIRAFKNHFLALLATTDSDFPKNAWDELVPQAELTLSHLRGYSPDKKLSSYEGIHGRKYDFMAHPLHVPGVRTVALTPADKRESWGPHGVDSFYLGPAPDHYRCYRVLIPSTNDIRITDSLSWHQTKTFSPGASKEELVYNKMIEQNEKLDELTILIKANPSYSTDPATQQLLTRLLSIGTTQPTDSPATSQRVIEAAPAQRVPLTPSEHPTKSTARERSKIKAAEKKEQREDPTSQYYKHLPRKELSKTQKLFYSYNGCCFTDTDDKLHFHITDIVQSTATPQKSKKRGKTHKLKAVVPFYKYYDTSKFSSAPLRTADYEYTPCDEIVQWHYTEKRFSFNPKHIQWDDASTASNSVTLPAPRGESLGTQYLRTGLSAIGNFTDKAYANSTYHSSPDDPRLNVTPEGNPLTMRSALSGPNGEKWRVEQGNEITRSSIRELSSRSCAMNSPLTVAATQHTTTRRLKRNSTTRKISSYGYEVHSEATKSITSERLRPLWPTSQRSKFFCSQ